MKFFIKGEEHRVVYVEYNGNVPHEVYTAVYSPTPKNGIPFWCLMNHWSFFANGNDEKDIRHYNSGGGGDAAQIQAPHWANGHIGQYWIDHSIAGFKGTPINAKELKHPKRLTNYYDVSSTNPFKVSEETYSYEYCEVCGFESIEMCDKHQYIDNDGELRYKHAHGHGYNY